MTTGRINQVTTLNTSHPTSAGGNAT